MADRRRTSTSSFGAGKRESHDASRFYERFDRPELIEDETVLVPAPITEPFQLGDARQMEAVPDGSVALVVTSPPYFAGKQYEEELEREGVPSSYAEFLDLLYEVFRECKRTLEPGGRIAVNVANLGRRPYRSLSGDVVRILQDELKLLLRGEVVWRKGEGAAGSCAWGSFRSPSNPVLRDLTERVIVASKGRFGRALDARQRAREGLPHESTISADEFMAATLDVWDIAPESARRVRHPAPFPAALPERLINLYTFRDDLVLDPFMGSGSTLVAAARLGRRYVGYDLDPQYVAIARERVAKEARTPAEEPVEDKAIMHRAADLLALAGFTVIAERRPVRGSGATVDLAARDATGTEWAFLVSGAFTGTPAGLARTDVVWREIGRASVLARSGSGPVVLLTSHRPAARSKADAALRTSMPDPVTDVVVMSDGGALDRLCAHAKAGPPRR